MKLRIFILTLGAFLLISCGGGSGSAPPSNSAEITTVNIDLSNIIMRASAYGLTGNKTRVDINMTVKADVNSDIQSDDVVALSNADAIQVMAYGVEKAAEKFVFPSGTFTYRAEFDANIANMPIDIWYVSNTGARIDIARVENLGQVLSHTSSYAGNTVSVVLDTSSFPADSFHLFSSQFLECDQGGNSYTYSTSIQTPFINDAYVRSLIDLFGAGLSRDGVDISNCSLDLRIYYSEKGLNNASLLWGDQTFNSGSAGGRQLIELKFTNL